MKYIEVTSPKSSVQLLLIDQPMNGERYRDEPYPFLLLSRRVEGGSRPIPIGEISFVDESMRSKGHHFTQISVSPPLWFKSLDDEHSVMRVTATTLLIGVTMVSVSVLVAAATVASLVTLGVHTWHHLLTVAPAVVLLDLVSGVVGLGVVIGLLAGVFRYAHCRRDPTNSALD